MKTLINTILILISIQFSFAQQSINYKALVKDDLGNVLNSQSVDVQFIIYEGAALSNNVYQESHTLMTDANGIIVLNIGEGTTSDVFTDVAWGNDEHWLNVQIDTGSGLIDMGTTQFMAVPYAFQAENVSGLEALNEGNGIGWRLIGLDPQDYGTVGQDAVDLSYSSSASTTRGATGTRSMASGQNTTASGFFSTAMGLGTIASGENATAIGSFTTASAANATSIGVNSIASGENATTLGLGTLASGVNSIAFGNSTIATGDNATAMGLGTEANAYSVVAVGRYNIGGGNPLNWDATDNVFEIGNGSSDVSRSNALTVLKNGTIMAPTFEMAQITDNKALITKEYADNNYTPSGLEALDEGNGMGWRLIGVNPNYYGNLGQNAVDLSFGISNSTTRGATGLRSIAIGNSTTASGNNSVAMGSSTSASGNGSTAIGSSATASGDISIAMGQGTTASGYISTALGLNTTASGEFTVAMGRNTNADAFISSAFGRYNIGGGDDLNWILTDKLFEVGNGTSDINRNNALTILKNGNVGISTDTPNTKLHITNGTDAVLNNNNSGYLILGDVNGLNTVYDENEIMARNNSLNSTLFIQSDGGNVSLGGSLFVNSGNITIGGNLLPETDNLHDLGSSVRRWDDIYASNGTIQTSDARDKTNITTLNYGLSDLMQLKPVSFNWKTNPNKDKKLGLIAQDLLKIIPEVVKNQNNNLHDKSNVTNERLGVYYSDLIPVLIKAIQEQQEIIDTQAAENTQQNTIIQSLIQRMNALESSNN